MACCSNTPALDVNLHFPYGWPEGYVLSAGHVLEQRIALEDKSDFPLLGGHPCGVLICTNSDTLSFYCPTSPGSSPFTGRSIFTLGCSLGSQGEASCCTQQVHRSVQLTVKEYAACRGLLQACYEPQKCGLACMMEFAWR